MPASAFPVYDKGARVKRQSRSFYPSGVLLFYYRTIWHTLSERYIDEDTLYR